MNGAIPQFSSIASPRRGGVFQSLSLILSPGLAFTCSGHVVNWQAYMEDDISYDLITFQVWRPVTACTWQLIGSHSVQDYTVGGDYLVNTSTILPSQTPIPVDPGDIVGIYVNQGSRAVGVQQYPGDDTVAYSRRTNAGNVGGLSDLNYCSSQNNVEVVMGAPIVNAQVIAMEGQLNRTVIIEV